MDTPSPNRVVLLFAISELGRQDAFRQGVSLGREDYDGRSGDNFWTDRLIGDPEAMFCTRVIDADSEPELFERATALEWELNEAGTAATVPIGTPYTDGNDQWRPDAPRLPGDGHVSISGELTYLSRVPRPVAERPPHLALLRHTMRAAFALPDNYADLDAYLDDEREDFEAHFEPFDMYPATEQLIAHEEASRQEAIERYSSFADEEPTLRARYESWITEQRDLRLSQLESFSTRITEAGGDPDDLRVSKYRSILEELTPDSPHYEVSRALSGWPQRMNEEFNELEKRARLAKELESATAWSEEHGSPRLRRIATEGLLGSSMSVYRDERLAIDRPGWSWQPVSVTLREPAAPDVEEFELLDEARESDPDARLRFATLGKGQGCFVAVSEFLGRKIWYPADALEQIEGVER